MDISPKAIRELRSRTQAGFLDCKKALSEAGGDVSKAIDLIRKKGMASAVKRSGKSAKEGCICVASAKTNDQQKVALFELNSETDFVARNDLFKEAADTFVQTAQKYLANNSTPLTTDSFKALTVDADITQKKDWVGKSVKEVAQMLAGTIGENISLSNLSTLQADSQDVITTYLHAGAKIGTAVCITGVNGTTDPVQQLTKDLAMHVAASAPLYLDPSQIPSTELEKEKQIYLEQAMASGKPKEIAEKIVMGKLNAFYTQVCLLKQPFIKEHKMSVEAYVEKVAKEIGQGLKVRSYLRLACGENQ